MCPAYGGIFYAPRREMVWLDYVGLASGALLFLALVQPEVELNAHWLMGFFFGALHLAYGTYLYLTEKGKNAA